MARKLKVTLDVDSRSGVVSVNKVTKSVDKMEKKSVKASKNINKGFSKVKVGLVALAAAVAASAKAFAGYSKGIIDYGDKLHKLGLRLGTTAGELDKLRQIAELSGVEFNTLTMALQRMNRRISEASSGTGVAVSALKELNITAKDINKLAPEEQFKLISRELMKVESSSKRVELAFKLFDSAGVSVTQMMRDLDEEMKNTTSTMNDEHAKAFAKFNDDWHDITEYWKQKTIPVLGKMLSIISDGINDIKAFDELEKTMPAKSLIDFKFNFKAYEDYRKAREAELILIARKLKLQKMLKKHSDFSNKGGDPDSGDGGAGAAAAAEEQLIKDLNKVSQDMHKRNLALTKQNNELEIYEVQLKYGKLIEKFAEFADIKLQLEETLAQEIAAINQSYADEEADRVSEEIEARLEAYNELQEKIGEAALQAQADRDEIRAKEKEADDEATAAKLANIEKVNKMITSGMTDALTDWINGTKSAEDAFREFAASFLQEIAKMILQQTILNSLQSATGGSGIFGSIIGGIAGMLAGGGKATGNKSYIVGEEGPEIFTPSSSGIVTPNHELGGGGSVNVVNNITIDQGAEGSDQEKQRFADQTARAITAKIKEVIGQERRFGGILYN